MDDFYVNRIWTEAPQPQNDDSDMEFYTVWALMLIAATLVGINHGWMDGAALFITTWLVMPYREGSPCN